jgi:hypothetical protein
VNKFTAFVFTLLALSLAIVLPAADSVNGTASHRTTLSASGSPLPAPTPPLVASGSPGPAPTPPLLSV